MTLVDVHIESADNPVDVIETIASANDWTFERSADDEIILVVAGAWCGYRVAFSWMEEVEALHVATALDLAVSDDRREEVVRALALVNEQLWIGHFDIWQAEGVVMYRNTLLLAGQAEVTNEQMEALIETAVDTCERHRLAFDFAVRGGRNAKDALALALMETVGEA